VSGGKQKYGQLIPLALLVRKSFDPVNYYLLYGIHTVYGWLVVQAGWLGHICVVSLNENSALHIPFSLYF
jgi:hypothetical protein